MAGTYITADMLSANVSDKFDVSTYIEEANEEIEDLAQRLGVADTTDISSPLHHKVKRYGICYALLRLSQDKIGTNTPDIALEKYTKLYELYQEELDRLNKQITKQMITNDVDEIVDRIGGGYMLYRD